KRLGPIHSFAIWTERQAVRNVDVHRCQNFGAIVPIEGAFDLSDLLQRKRHGSNPETPLAVALPIVKAPNSGIEWGLLKAPQRAISKVQVVNSILAWDDCPATASKDEAAWRRRQIPYAILA